MGRGYRGSGGYQVPDIITDDPTTDSDKPSTAGTSSSDDTPDAEVEVDGVDVDAADLGL